MKNVYVLHYLDLSDFWGESWWWILWVYKSAESAYYSMIDNLYQQLVDLEFDESKEIKHFNENKEVNDYTKKELEEMFDDYFSYLSMTDYEIEYRIDDWYPTCKLSISVKTLFN